ncbi:hypothetical protein HN587_06015 [Candidatus Woesearchaeota archaeon]|jgi:hypothetical protein|nr:hypothetical protein [Candidatus Woesearchaeota archaeon]
MKKIILLISILMCLTLLSFVNGTEITHYPGNPNIGFENTANYNVIFDGEGEAEIIAKINMINLNSELNTIILEIPGNIRIINAIQEYDASDRDEQTDEQRNKYYYNNPKHYAKINYSKTGFSETNVYEFKLANPTRELESTSIILHYKANGYVQPGFNKKFEFKTIKIGHDQTNVRVAIDVVDGLYLKNGKSKIGYYNNYGVFDSAKGMQSREISQAVSRIGYTGQYTKQTGGLDPWETYNVYGTYTDSWLVYNLTPIIVILGLISLVFFIGIIGFKKLKKTKEPKLKSYLAGIGSVIGISILWGLEIFLLVNLRDLVGYQYDDLIGALSFIIILLITLVTLILTPIYVGLKSKSNYGFMVVVVQVISAIIILVLGTVILVILGV